jgi:hypothetical protein
MPMTVSFDRDQNFALAMSATVRPMAFPFGTSSHVSAGRDRERIRSGVVESTYGRLRGAISEAECDYVGSPSGMIYVGRIVPAIQSVNEPAAA